MLPTSPEPPNFNPRSPGGERLTVSRLQSIRLFNFNPRSPGGERPAGVSFAVRKLAISIHAPREGSDELTYIRHLTAFISIHAPREGSDGAAPGDGGRRMDFNPRSP